MLFARLMRRHVTVALSGDGGDEAFGGYDLYWQNRQNRPTGKDCPESVWRQGSYCVDAFSWIGDCARTLTANEREIEWCGRHSDSSRSILLGAGGRTQSALPERRCSSRPPAFRAAMGISVAPARLPDWNAFCTHTEVNTRLMLPNDFLFKVDTASMRESLEVRVPMLDEELFAFGLSLPHRLKVDGPDV